MVQDTITWNRNRARDVLGPGVRVAVRATEGGKPAADSPFVGDNGIALVVDVVAAPFNVTRRGGDTTPRFLALTADALVLCEETMISGRLAPGRELTRVPIAEIVRSDSTSGMLVITMPGRRELWVKSFESQPLRDALRTGR